LHPEPDGAGGWVVRDSKGRVLMRMPRGGYYFDTVYHPLERIRGRADVEKYNWDAQRTILKKFYANIV